MFWRVKKRKGELGENKKSYEIFLIFRIAQILLIVINLWTYIMIFLKNFFCGPKVI